MCSKQSGFMKYKRTDVIVLLSHILYNNLSLSLLNAVAMVEYSKAFDTIVSYNNYIISFNFNKIIPSRQSTSGKGKLCEEPHS